MHEVNEAAKVITESIDKDAKVIFGTTHDDRMKKGDLKVTVIATGFAGENPKPRPTRVEPKEIPQPIREAPVQQVEEKREVATPAPADYIKKQPEKIIIDDDFEEGGDDWSAVPAFLRRPKK
jgi:cell division protein FtsZ